MMVKAALATYGQVALLDSAIQYEIFFSQTMRDVGGRLDSIDQPFDFLRRSIHPVWWLYVPSKIRRFDKEGHWVGWLGGDGKIVIGCDMQ